jgi:hypothetical protein
MENYLTGREGGNNLDVSTKDSSFRSFLSEPTDSQTTSADLEPVEEGISEVIFDEKDCPKVEVISVDSKPSQIVVHLEDGRLLKINCEY